MADADPARERRIGLACAILLIVVWAGFHVAARLGASQQMTPWDMAALRMGGAFLGALALLLWFRPPRLPPPRALALVATAGFGFPLFAYAGYAFAPAAHGAVLMAGVLPFATAILAALFLAERFTARQAAALAAVGLGAALLGADMWGDHPGAWIGDLLFLCAILSWALFTLLIRRWRVAAMEATLTVALWCAPIYLPLWWLLLPSTLGQAPAGAIACQAAWQGVAAVIVAGFLFARAVAALGPVPTTTITAAVPPVAALAAWPLLGEALGLAGLAGVAVVAAGMALGVGGGRRR
ncbi:MAG: DMT family transporter [Acetobacteraceae bacterium]|nr:DMT family transporter [Acetobacteraceae bacterium]